MSLQVDQKLFLFNHVIKLHFCCQNNFIICDNFRVSCILMNNQTIQFINMSLCYYYPRNLALIIDNPGKEQTKFLMNMLCSPLITNSAV